MKFEEIFLSLLKEQDDPNGPDFDFLDRNPDEDPDEDPNNLFGGDEVADDDEEEPEGRPIAAIPNHPLNPNQTAKPAQSKKITEIQKIKMKWISQQPGLTDPVMDEHIQFFKERKEKLRPYKPYGTIDPQTNRYYVNLPEVTAQLEKFPNMENILKDPQKIKDIQNYDWEQISFYMDRILNQNRIIDEENFVLGDKNIDEKLQESYKRWTLPHNRIINENKLIVYKIESKNESIALGSVQRYIHEKYSKNESRSHPWCIAHPPDNSYGPNLYNTYRESITNKDAFYFLMDKSRVEIDNYYIVAISVKGPPMGDKNNPYTLTPRINNYGDAHNYSWDSLLRLYPGLNGKQDLFKYFGPTRKEQVDFTLDLITFKKGDPYDFATLSPEIQDLYIDSNRYINEVRSFLTLEPGGRKLYIDKTSNINNDYKSRYKCNDHNDPFGILNAIKNVKQQDYNRLDYILKQHLHIPQGILAIKLSIIGTDWKRWLSDYETNYTVCSIRGKNDKYNRTTKYGIVNLNTAADESGDYIVKDFAYILTSTKAYIKFEEDENGIIRKIPYMLQRYAKSLGGTNISGDDYFSFLYPKDDILNKNSVNYLKGKYFDGQEAEKYMQSKIENKEFVKI